jgi:hypothetical protein
LNENKNGDLLIGLRGGEIIEMQKADIREYKLIN